LGSLLKSLSPVKDPNLLVGFDTSDDAGVYKIREDLALVQTVDLITPVCDDPHMFGRIAAANSLSDVYAMGGKPLTVLNICCFPPRGIPAGILEQIMGGAHEMVTESGAVLVGGHTVKDDELKFGLSVTGTIDPEKILKNGGARPGDSLILTKPVGTGVLVAGSKSGKLAPEPFRKALELMAHLNAVAGKLASEHGASACTDITGFGLAGHGLEMARGSGASLRIRFASLPHFNESLDLIDQGVTTGVTGSNRELAGDAIVFKNGLSTTQQALFFDPQTSGGLLIAIAGNKAESLLRDLHDGGEGESRIIGEIYPSDSPGIEVVAS
jgi:selenide,water dikinase